MARPDDSFPEAPPEIPEIGRRYHRRHALGMGLLAILPVIAAFGLLSTGMKVEREASSALDVVVEYPARVRATDRASVRISVSGRAGHAVEGPGVVVDPAYLYHFTVQGTTPSWTAPGVVELPALAPGDVASVVLDLEAVRFGFHRGTVRVGAADGDTLVVTIRTLILP